MKTLYTFLLALFVFAAGCSDTVVSPDAELSNPDEFSTVETATMPAPVQGIAAGSKTAMVQVIHNLCEWRPRHR